MLYPVHKYRIVWRTDYFVPTTKINKSHYIIILFTIAYYQYLRHYNKIIICNKTRELKSNNYETKIYDI